MFDAGVSEGAPLLQGWERWLRWRCQSNPDHGVSFAQSQPALIDGLSFPLSLLFALDRLGFGRDALRKRSAPSNNGIERTVINFVVVRSALAMHPELIFISCLNYLLVMAPQVLLLFNAVHRAVRVLRCVSFDAKRTWMWFQTTKHCALLGVVNLRRPTHAPKHMRPNTCVHECTTIPNRLGRP